jgi:hypothetical protein
MAARVTFPSTSIYIKVRRKMRKGGGGGVKHLILIYICVCVGWLVHIMICVCVLREGVFVPVVTILDASSQTGFV